MGILLGFKDKGPVFVPKLYQYVLIPVIFKLKIFLPHGRRLVALIWFRVPARLYSTTGTYVCISPQFLGLHLVWKQDPFGKDLTGSKSVNICHGENSRVMMMTPIPFYIQRRIQHEAKWDCECQSFGVTPRLYTLCSLTRSKGANVKIFVT